MKSMVFAAIVLSACLTASGQVNSAAPADNQAGSKPTTDQTTVTATGSRAVGPDQEIVAANKPSRNASLDTPVMGNSSLKPDGPANTITMQSNTVASASPPVATPPTQLYRVGVGDVLDIKLSANPLRSSTLFTVLENGVLEYPLAGNPIVVSGLTTAEIAAVLRQKVKIFDNPIVSVEVRDYASHRVLISGLVAAAGTKILRREAVPLYTMLAEALVLPEAGRATITRQGQASIVVDLKDANVSEMLVIPGDAIRVSGLPPPPTEFFFVGGEINSPGQKPYHPGLTLTQALLASGGTKASAGSRVRVSRQGADGKLGTEEFNLRKIQSGKTPDPVLQNGDRIEITNTN